LLVEINKMSVSSISKSNSGDGSQTAIHRKKISSSRSDIRRSPSGPQVGDLNLPPLRMGGSLTGQENYLVPSAKAGVDTYTAPKDVRTRVNPTRVRCFGFFFHLLISFI
jgi:hypothetical protein